MLSRFFSATAAKVVSRRSMGIAAGVRPLSGDSGKTAPPLSLVKELREMTSAGLMDCKKALTENGHDLNMAAKWLRHQGLSKISKRAGKAAAAGLVSLHISSDLTRAAIAEVNTETDFVTKTDNFMDLADSIAADLLVADATTLSHNGHYCEIADGSNSAQNNDSSGDLDSCPIMSTASEAQFERYRNWAAEVSAVMGEKVVVRRVSVVHAAPGGVVSGYIHQPIKGKTTLGAIGSAISIAPPSSEYGSDSFSRENFSERISDVGTKISMHIAAMAPIAVSPEEVPAERIAEEKAHFIAELEQQNQGKSAKKPEIVDKIIDGKMRKWIAEVALTEQAFCLAEDPKAKEAKIANMLNGAKIVAMERFKAGEGIEVEEVDFAEEVAREIVKN